MDARAMFIRQPSVRKADKAAHGLPVGQRATPGNHDLIPAVQTCQNADITGLRWLDRNRNTANGAFICANRRDAELFGTALVTRRDRNRGASSDGSGDEPRGGKTVITDEFLVEGKLEKPSAYYILRRSSLDYDWARLDAKFSPLVLESVQDPLF